VAYPQAAVSQAAKPIVALRRVGGSCQRSRVTRMVRTFGWEENATRSTESEFKRKPVLENCAFFACVQCGYCGYLILGGSAKELRDEDERHAIECKATHGLIGAGNLRAHEQKHRVFRETRVLRWSTAVYMLIARWL
jgi:hypothetical protein